MNKGEILIENNYVLTEISYDNINENEKDVNLNAVLQAEDNFNRNCLLQPTPKSYALSQNEFYQYNTTFMEKYNFSNELLVYLFENKKANNKIKLKQLSGDRFPIPDFNEDIFKEINANLSKNEGKILENIPQNQIVDKIELNENEIFNFLNEETQKKESLSKPTYSIITNDNSVIKFIPNCKNI